MTVGEILQALGAVGGKEALGLVEEVRDPKIEAVVGSWPAGFDIQRAEGLALKGDVSLAETVRAFAASLNPRAGYQEHKY